MSILATGAGILVLSMFLIFAITAFVFGLKAIVERYRLRKFRLQKVPRIYKMGELLKAMQILNEHAHEDLEKVNEAIAETCRQRALQDSFTEAEMENFIQINSIKSISTKGEKND